MKNDLTSKEWKILAYYLENPLWKPSDSEQGDLDVAISKVIMIGKDIRI